MRILLTTLNAKYVHSNLALKYLYSVVDDSGLDVNLFEYTINNDKSYVYTEILRGGYDLVCFSCYIWNMEQIKELGANLKKACPKMKILLGGPEVSYETKTLMEENPWIDFVLRGEGEYPFFQFCKELVLERFDFTRVRGLSWRRGTLVLENKDAPLLEMDQIPFPYEKLPMENDRVIYYESSRGCPYRCSYCLSSLEKTIRPLSLERTKRELSYFLNQKVKQVKFIDRTFNYDKERAHEIWRFLIENDNGVTNFHFEICGEILDDRLFALLEKARPGLFQFEIGIQSTNEEVLAGVDRRNNIDAILTNVSRLVAMGNIHIHVDLIAGLPFEDYQSFGHSFDKVYALGADNLQLGFLKLLKGTKVRRQIEEHGFVFREKAPYEIIANKYLSSVDLIKLKMIENVLDLYANKGGFVRSLDYLEEKVGTSAFNFYEHLADFFYSRGFQHRSHKKEDLYRILLKFAEGRDSQDENFVVHVKKLLSEDLEETMNPDTVKRFHKKGWDI